MPYKLMLVCALALVAWWSPSSAHAGKPQFTPGSSGLGDPFFPDAGNGGYDVRHYSLRLNWEPTRNVLAGTAEIEATATQNLSRFDLDLRGFEIAELRVDGQSASFARDGQELVITPRHGIVSGDSFTVEVEYSGVPGVFVNPDGSPSGWIPTDDGAFVAAEPVGSPEWYPVNDSPRDKATIAVSVTVPAGLTVMSNGVLVSTNTHHGKTTWAWRERAPIAPYLVTATIGRFDLTKTAFLDGTPSYVAVDPRFDDRSVLAQIPAMVDFFTAKFGPYPFDSAGAIVDSAPDVRYSLETQTKPLFWEMPNDIVLAHELAHQWFGDSVTPVRWSDTWLNEGFATFAQFLWGEQAGGPTLEELLQQFLAVPAFFPLWVIPPGAPPSADLLFDHFAIYLRGAATLEALREKIGDDSFYAILRDWAAGHRWGNGTTEQFIALAEHDSGLDLGHFFRVWLYEPTKPTSW